jgi:membrane fusion protein (multidrug efflux system)
MPGEKLDKRVIVFDARIDARSRVARLDPPSFASFDNGFSFRASIRASATRNGAFLGSSRRRERITSLTKFLAIALVAVSLALSACGGKEKGKLESPPEAQATLPAAPDEIQVETVQVNPQTVTYTLSAVGSLQTPEHVTISPKKAGIIEKILVREGDRVSRGQVLVQLNDVDVRLQVEMAEAKVREAEANLETSRTTLDRYEKLLESKVIPQQVYDDNSLKVKLNEARLALAKSELNLARQSLSDHRIVSPVEGVVNVKIASLGEHVNVAPKDEIVTIVQMDPLDLEFYVPEGWAGKIRPGTRVQFTVRAFSDEKFAAVLQFVSPTADPATRNVKMKAEVRNPQYRLKPGFFAEVAVQTGTNPSALLVPESALFSQEGRFFLYVARDGAVQRREVETGLRFEGKAEIVKGVEAGAWVVTAGQEQLHEGSKVRISTKSQISNSK